MRDEKLARWVGEELKLKVIELDRGRNRLVFSERATVWGPKDGERLLQEITPGEMRHGRVSNLVDFGAFVDLGGVDALFIFPSFRGAAYLTPGRFWTLAILLRYMSSALIATTAASR